MRIVSYLLTLALGWVVYLVCPTEYGMAWAAAAIGAGMSVLSSLYGGRKASEAAQKAQAYLDKAEAEEKAWYERNYNQRYADTEAGQQLLTKARDLAAQNWRKADGAARVAGGTDAAAARMKEQGNKMIGDTLSTIAANDTARRDRVDQLHRTAQNSIYQQRIGIENQRAQNITDAASAASNALMQAGATYDAALEKNRNVGDNTGGQDKDEEEK